MKEEADSFDVVFHPAEGLRTHISKRAQKRPPNQAPPPPDCPAWWEVGQKGPEEKPPGRPSERPPKTPGPGRPGKP